MVYYFCCSLIINHCWVYLIKMRMRQTIELWLWYWQLLNIVSKLIRLVQSSWSSFGQNLELFLPFFALFSYHKKMAKKTWVFCTTDKITENVVRNAWVYCTRNIVRKYSTKKSGKKCVSILYHVQIYQKSRKKCVSILYQKIAYENKR